MPVPRPRSPRGTVGARTWGGQALEHRHPSRVRGSLAQHGSRCGELGGQVAKACHPCCLPRPGADLDPSLVPSIDEVAAYRVDRIESDRRLAVRRERCRVPPRWNKLGAAVRGGRPCTHADDQCAKERKRRDNPPPRARVHPVLQSAKVRKPILGLRRESAPQHSDDRTRRPHGEHRRPPKLVLQQLFRRCALVWKTTGDDLEHPQLAHS
ncbi:MAG: hypothetical protein ACRBN8_32250 [Nannocystales bacterium]